jgi:hypothetical protein
MQALHAGSEVHPGAAVPFQFELSWRCLTQPESFTETKQWDGVLALVKPRVSTLAGPSFALATGAPEGGLLHNRTALAGFALLLVTIGFAAVRRIEQPATPAADAPMATVEMGGAGWMTEWVTDSAGSSHGRQISLYRPSLPMSNYRLEFSGRIERKSLGWAFRRVDPRNYYVGKLQVSKPGGPVNLVRYGVVRGIEDSHIQIPLPAVSGAGALKVRLDAKGSRFTIYVQNQAVADWEDHRLQKGGVGFLSERGEQGQVESVQISF